MMNRACLMGAEIAFRLNLVHGRCVGLHTGRGGREILAGLVPRSAASSQAWLPPATRAGSRADSPCVKRFATSALSPARSWLPGAAHPHCPLALPAQSATSARLAVGLAGRPEDGASIGVDPGDLSASFRFGRGSPRPGSARPAHARAHPRRTGPAAKRAKKDHRRMVTLHFSLKEALYKAIDPLLGRHVGFHEASLTTRSDGSARSRSPCPRTTAHSPPLASGPRSRLTSSPPHGCNEPRRFPGRKLAIFTNSCSPRSPPCSEGKAGLTETNPSPLTSALCSCGE